VADPAAMSPRELNALRIEAQRDASFRQRIEEVFSAQAGLLRAEYDRSVAARSSGGLPEDR